MSRLRRHPALVFAAAVASFAALAPASPAFAHDPIFLTDDQTTPDTGPYLPDGAISWALYGTFPEAGQTRGFEFDLRDGDDLFIGLLIPNLEPEVDLPDPELPYAELTMPDGEIRVLEPQIREVFDEQFSQTSYVTLVEITEPAVAGRHTVVVHSRAPSRFVVAVGQREEFFTPAERTVDRPTNFLAIAEPLNAWYQTPPGAEAPVADESGDEVQVDVEAVEAELEAMAEESAASTAPEETSPESPAEDEDEAASVDDTEADDVANAADAGADVEEAASEPEAGPVGDVDLDGDGSELAWVVPLAIVVAAAGGIGIWLAKRRSSSA